MTREYTPLMQLLPAYEKRIVPLDEYVPNLPAGIKNVTAWELRDRLLMSARCH